MENRTLYHNLRWILSVALFASFLIFEANINGKYIYLGITILIFIIYLIHNHGKITIRFNYFLLVTIPFILYGFASSIWALDSTYTFKRMTTVFETVVCLGVVHMSYDDDLDSESFLNAIRWTGYVVSLYAIYFYGLETIRFIVQSGNRLDSNFANINSIGVIAAYSIIITYAQIIYKKFRWDMLLAIPAILVTVASGSRKALIALVVGIFIVALIRQIKNTNNPINAFVRVVTIAALIIVSYYFILQLPALQSLTRRMQFTLNFLTGEGRADQSSINRMNYIMIGVEQFKKSPFFGIGIDNSRVISSTGTYLHSNVFELLACGGIFGIVAFYWGFIYLLRRFKGFNKSNYIVAICTTLIFTQLVLDFVQVSYWAKDTYVYLLLFAIQAKAIKNETACDKSIVIETVDNESINIENFDNE